MTITSTIRFRAAPSLAGATIRHLRARAKARFLTDTRDARAHEQTLLWLMNLRARIAEAELKQTSQISG